MTISEEINAIKAKYTPKNVPLEPSHYCKNPYALSLGECQRCGYCGRTFEEIKDANSRAMEKI